MSRCVCRCKHILIVSINPTSQSNIQEQPWIELSMGRTKTSARISSGRCTRSTPSKPPTSYHFLSDNNGQPPDEPLVNRMLRENSLTISRCLKSLSDVTTLHDRVCKSLRMSHMHVMNTVYCYPKTAETLLARHITLVHIAGWSQDRLFRNVWTIAASGSLDEHYNKFHVSQLVCSPDLTGRAIHKMQHAYKKSDIEEFCLEDFPIHAIRGEFMYGFPPTTTDLTLVRPEVYDPKNDVQEDPCIWFMNLEDCPNLRTFQVFGELYFETCHWYNFHLLTELHLVDDFSQPTPQETSWVSPDMSMLCRNSRPVWALKFLRLRNCRLSTVQWLNHMPELLELDISLNPGLLCLEPLGGCQKLAALDLRQTVIYDKLHKGIWRNWVQRGMIGGSFQGCVIFLNAKDAPTNIPHAFTEPCQDSAHWALFEVVTQLNAARETLGSLRHIRLDYQTRKVQEGLLETNFWHGPLRTAMLTIFSRPSVEDDFNAPNDTPPPNQLGQSRGWDICDAWYLST